MYVEIFKHLEWEQLALLAEDREGYPEFQGFLKDAFQQNGLQVLYDRKMPRLSANLEDMAHAAKVKIPIILKFCMYQQSLEWSHAL